MKLILILITWSYRFLAARIAQPVIGYRWKCSLWFPYCTALCRIFCSHFSHCWHRCWVLFSFCSSKSRLFLYFIFLCSVVSLLSSLCVRFILFSQFCCFYVLCCVVFTSPSHYISCATYPLVISKIYCVCLPLSIVAPSLSSHICVYTSSLPPSSRYLLVLLILCSLGFHQ